MVTATRFGEEGNDGSPVGFAASKRVENGERLTAELWVKFGGLRRSEERARARRSELATVSSLRTLFWRERRGREEMGASTLLGATPWTTCARWGLTSGARNDVRTTNVAVALPPVGHVGELDFDSENTTID